MSWEIWLAFMAVAAALIAVPGPTVLVVMGYALSAGRRRGLACLAGVAAGDVTAMTASFAGFGAVLAASATAFLVLKVIGAIYLIYLGAQMWRSPARALAGARTPADDTTWNAITHAFSVTVLNPKSIVFFGAFLPQFMSPTAAALPQMLVLGTTFVALALVIQSGYVMLLGSMRGVLSGGRAAIVLQRTGGSLLIGAGAMTAALQRTA